MNILLLVLTTMLFLVQTVEARPKLVLVRIQSAPDQFFSDEILKVAYDRLGMDIEIKDMPAKRALKESSEGRVDGEVHRTFAIGENNPSLLRVSNAISYVEPSVFSNKFNFEVTDCEALKEYSVGIVRGINFPKKCTAGMPHVVMVNSPAKLLKLLDADRIDIAIISKDNGLWLSKQLETTSVHLLSPPLKRLPLYHYLHEKHEALVSKIDKVLQEMEKSGELQRIRESTLQDINNNLSTQLSQKVSTNNK